MKFRYKVMLANLTVLSICLGIVGYLMIRNNFELAWQTQLGNATVKNNLVQYTLEYALLQQLLEREISLEETLRDLGMQTARNLPQADATFYVKYDNQYLYSYDGNEERISSRLFEDLQEGGKNYIVLETEGKYLVYVTSCSQVQEHPLNIITCSDISGLYEMLDNQIRYFTLVLVVVLLAAALAAYGFSRLLTHPLESLERAAGEIASGCYSTRAKVQSSDEVGELATRFNDMAQAVGEHMQELQEEIQRREQFVADFSHELKTPMTSMIGYADTLRSYELPREEQLLALNYIVSEGKRLESMSFKLFDLIYLKWNEIEMAEVPVREVLGIAERSMLPLLKSRQQSLVIHVEPGKIWGNCELLAEAVINLIDNAGKASPEGGSIEITGERQEFQYRLQITDYGMGMSEDTLRHICDEFFMEDKSRARKQGGAGIGMSLVAAIMESHHIKWGIESEPGRGTNVYMVIHSREEAK